MAVIARFVVEDREKGRRLDKFLAEKFPSVSRSVIVRFLEEGLALVDGSVAGKSLRLRAGQGVEFEPPAPEPGSDAVPPRPMEIDFLYRDADLVVVNKPPGLCVHPSPGHRDDTLVNGLLHLFPCMAYVGSVKRPGVVHRIDLDTSGALAVALSPPAYAGLTGLIRVKRMRREYLCVVHGVPRARSGTIALPIGRDPSHRRRFAAFPPGASPAAKPAVTHYDVAEDFGTHSLLSIRLETGRTHQIRVHMKAVGHPVYGDRLYAPDRDHALIARQALHACRLEFPHPVTGAEVRVEAPLPEDMRRLLEVLRSRSA